MKINDIITLKNYTAAVHFADANNCIIQKVGRGQYQIVPRPLPVITEQIQRQERDVAIEKVIWRVQRYEQQKALQIPSTDSEETYKKLLQYIQSLRDLPEQADFPNVEIPSFESWLNNQI